MTGDETKIVKRMRSAQRRRIVALKRNSKNMELDIDAYNKRFDKAIEKFVVANEAPFDLSFEMNKTKTKIKSLVQDWVKVFAISGTSQQLEDMAKVVKSSEGNASIHNATSVYLGNNFNSRFAKAIENGKKIAFVVTGKEATDKIKFLEYGWSSLASLSRKVERFISLGEDSKKDIVHVLEAMKH
ncbi:hypothetical protein IJ425_00875 [bacterium]|nr:hypothetical protein [bacterium]